MTTHDYTDRIEKMCRDLRKEDSDRYEAKLEKKDEKLDKQRDEYCEKLDKQRDEYCEKIEKIKKDCNEKLEKIKEEYETKIKQVKKDHEEESEKKIEKIKKDNENINKMLEKIKTIKINKITSWQRTNSVKFTTSGCENEEVIATLAKNMGCSDFMTGDIIQDRVKLMLIMDCECASFAKKCRQLLDQDQRDSNTSASVTEL